MPAFDASLLPQPKGRRLAPFIASRECPRSHTATPTGTPTVTLSTGRSRPRKQPQQHHHITWLVMTAANQQLSTGRIRTSTPAALGFHLCEVTLGLPLPAGLGFHLWSGSDVVLVAGGL